MGDNNRKIHLGEQKKQIETEVEETLSQDHEYHLDVVLSKTTLIPIQGRLIPEYDNVSAVQYPPIALAKAVIYRKARALSRPALVELLRENPEVAKNFGFNANNLPNTNTFKVFEQQKLTMPTEILINHVADYLREEYGNELQFTLEAEDPTQRIEEEQDPHVETSLGQDWVAYNAAQTNEKVMFKRLAAELIGNIEDKRAPAKGRNGYDVQTKIFALLMKEYSNKSGRRVISELEEGKEQGLIDEVPHFNSLYNFYGDVALTGLLHKLITVTALPLKQVEQDFTVDATGLATDMYKCWHDTKFNDVGERREYRKLHVTSGVKTNIITSVEVTDGMAGDSPQFTKMIQETADYFNIREVSADKAYSSRENLQTVTDVGGVPFIPFKSNTHGKARGAMTWNRMYQYFQRHRDEFMRHYHKRSNAETVFSMMKTKIGTKLSNEKELNQLNEALVKCIVHNLIVLIHEMHELGVDVDLDYCAEQVLAQK